jgi:Mn2+/Fe2+ NRAMP family transporter
MNNTTVEIEQKMENNATEINSMSLKARLFNGFSKLLTSLKAVAKFIGPGYMIAVGYLDPGNWATDLSAGSTYGYDLLFIILLASIFSVLLQSLCVKLGSVTGKDLAESCRLYYPMWVNVILYALCEIAIIATDLAGISRFTFK